MSLKPWYRAPHDSHPWVLEARGFLRWHLLISQMFPTSRSNEFHGRNEQAVGKMSEGPNLALGLPLNWEVMFKTPNCWFTVHKVGSSFYLVPCVGRVRSSNGAVCVSVFSKL